jgi:hypothetical protein
MKIDLKEFTRSANYGEPLVSGNLAVFPLFIEGGGEGFSYLLLEEALQKECLEIEEVSESGNVNTIMITNYADEPVLILDGDQILGAKQNRMINATILVPAACKRMEVPVSCVERGRWRYRSRGFDRAGDFGYSKLRKEKAEQVHYSLKRERRFDADQGAIWSEIDRKQAAMHAASPTDALHEVYEQRGEELDDMVNRLNPADGQQGIAVFINDRFVCLDLFDSPQTLAKLWKRLLKSYAMEALEQNNGKSPGLSTQFEKVREAIAVSECSAFPSVGLGSDVRMTGPGIVGAGLAVDDRFLHLSVFSAGPERQSPDY